MAFYDKAMSAVSFFSPIAIVNDIKTRLEPYMYKPYIAQVKKDWLDVEGKLENALNKITKCDESTFFIIFHNYEPIRHKNTNPANPTDALKTSVQSIGRANLTKAQKETEIANAIKNFIVTHTDRKFCSVLLENMSLLQSNSSKLEAESNLNNGGGLIQSALNYFSLKM